MVYYQLVYILSFYINKLKVLWKNKIWYNIYNRRQTIFNHCVVGGKPMDYCFRKGRRINHQSQQNIDPPIPSGFWFWVKFADFLPPIELNVIEHRVEGPFRVEFVPLLSLCYRHASLFCFVLFWFFYYYFLFVERT